MGHPVDTFPHTALRGEGEGSEEGVPRPFLLSSYHPPLLPPPFSFSFLISPAWVGRWRWRWRRCSSLFVRPFSLFLQFFPFLCDLTPHVPPGLLDGEIPISCWCCVYSGKNLTRSSASCEASQHPPSPALLGLLQQSTVRSRQPRTTAMAEASPAGRLISYVSKHACLHVWLLLAVCWKMEPLQKGKLTVRGRFRVWTSRTKPAAVDHVHRPVPCTWDS